MDFRTRYNYNPKTDFIAKGGFARVFRAEDVMLERQVALKVYSSEASGKYDLIREIRKVIQLEHPNLCRYYDVAVLQHVTAMGEEEELQVGVMEYLDGGDIKSYVKQYPQHLKKLLVDVLQGLSYLHQHNIIHRDLKPANILVKNTPTGPVAKITDFGISKNMDSSSTKSSELLGTVEYMAPEQFYPQKYGLEGKISYNLDLWSFGCLVYEMIRGESFFGRKDALSTEQVVRKILEEVDQTNIDSLPEPFRTTVKRCLVRDARERVQWAEELIVTINSGCRQFKKDEYVELINESKPHAKTENNFIIEDTKELEVKELTNLCVPSYNQLNLPITSQSEVSVSKKEKQNEGVSVSYDLFKFFFLTFLISMLTSLVFLEIKDYVEFDIALDLDFISYILGENILFYLFPTFILFGFLFSYLFAKYEVLYSKLIASTVFFLIPLTDYLVNTFSEEWLISEETSFFFLPMIVVLLFPLKRNAIHSVYKSMLFPFVVSFIGFAVYKAKVIDFDFLDSSIFRIIGDGILYLLPSFCLYGLLFEYFFCNRRLNEFRSTVYASLVYIFAPILYFVIEINSWIETMGYSFGIAWHLNNDKFLILIMLFPLIFYLFKNFQVSKIESRWIGYSKLKPNV